MSGREQHYFGVALAACGVGVLLMELSRYWMYLHPIHAWPVVIGCLIAFLGFYLLNPSSARDGAQIVVDSAVRIIGVVRSGRRSTDVRVIAEPLPSEATPDGLSAADESGDAKPTP